MSEASWISWLDEADEVGGPSGADEQQLDMVGGKGVNLRRLLHLGLPVPPGFVITTTAYRLFLAANDLEGLEAPDPESLYVRIPQAPLPDQLRVAILAAYERLGSSAVAVRSSGTAEDLAAASFAGQHDTFLDVSGPEALLGAVRACWASLWTSRAVAYRHRTWDGRAAGDAAGVAGGSAPLALAVVVQAMVPAEAAGVAFTANPITGDRDETTISAVRGLGERLVSGEGAADEWVVRGVGEDAEALCMRAPQAVLTIEQVVAIADLARRIEQHFGTPQDVEWAIAGGKLFVLQARPMTALPEPAKGTTPLELVTWTPPAKGGWMRNFRLGEWLPEPVTPLCQSWLLDRIEAGEVAAEARDYGLRPRPPYHVLVNGWYFSSPIGGGLPLRGVARTLVRHPRRIAALALSTTRPDVAERLFIASVAHRWRRERLPRYQQVVASWDARVDTATSSELVLAIDEVATVAGEYLWDFSVAGGHAWKAEHALARFCRRHLPSGVAHGHQALLLGLPVRLETLPAPYPAAPPHAVQSLDWIRPTLGEGKVPRDAIAAHDLAARRTRLEVERHATEAACRAALASQPTLRRRFDTLLALAQRYAVLREEQASWFTLGWPVLRRAVLRLGDELRLRGALGQAEEVFFLTRAEVEARLGVGGQESQKGQENREGLREAEPGANPLRMAVAARRQEWEHQRLLSPPLVLGNPLGARVIARATDAMRAPGAWTEVETTGEDHSLVLEVLTGMPASPGRAMGAVRIVRGPEDFGRFLAGEVLVAQVTAPAWTLLFGLAAAVVTDGGSLAAHASLVAREYGIPAVVGVGDATARLRDGQRVMVDGDRGNVLLLDARAGATPSTGD